MGIKSFVRDKCVKMFSMSIWQVHEQGAVITILTMNIYARKLRVQRQSNLSFDQSDRNNSPTQPHETKLELVAHAYDKALSLRLSIQNKEHELVHQQATQQTDLKAVSVNGQHPLKEWEQGTIKCKT